MIPGSSGGSMNPIHTDWKKHFAWREVTTVSGKKIWLKTCYRRSTLWTSTATRGSGLTPYYEYATAFDLLKL